MTASLTLYMLAASVLAGLGIYGVLIAGHLLRKLLALNLLGMAVLLMLITLGARGTGAPDPVTQAMVITGIIISISATSLALALLLALQRVTDETHLDAEPLPPVGEDGDAAGSR
ncbi:MAG: NADH-quinone oxidoreductase subunit K [Chromatiales bacterium]|nr:NADH-quinone oxidoreductase subunit K [Chromatiales bacterium]